MLLFMNSTYYILREPYSSVCRVTGYMLEGPGFNPRWVVGFHSMFSLPMWSADLCSLLATEYTDLPGGKGGWRVVLIMSPACVKFKGTEEPCLHCPNGPL